MASQSEIALVDAAEQPAASKPRKTRARRAAPPKRAKRVAPRKTAKDTQPAGTDIVPVMKLRAIDIVDDAKPTKTRKRKSPAAKEVCQQAIQMPPPAFTPVFPATQNVESKAKTNADGSLPNPGDVNGDHLVTDPELLELLEQLSVTIDTANNVLDAAATLPAEEIGSGRENMENTEPRPEPAPKPGSDPVPTPETETEPPLPLAARVSSESAPQPSSGKDSLGLGLVANTALTGLVFAAGVAWLLHTNPWLMEEKTFAPVDSEIPVSQTEIKDQASLQTRSPAVKLKNAVPSPVLASFSPPDDDLAPMETVSPPESTPAAAILKPSRGQVGQAIALNIALPTGQGDGEMSAMIQGVPDKAKLSSGKSLGGGTWLLNAPQLKGVKLTTGKNFKPGNYELEVILVRSDGKVPETRKIPVTVMPVIVGPVNLKPTAVSNATRAKADAVVPEAARAKTAFVKPGVAIQVAAEPVIPAPNPASSRLAQQEVRLLLTRGDTLLSQGDVAGARLLLEYAANSGNKQAMVRLGNSYDPEHLAKLGVRGVQPDEARAVHWYDRAAKSAPTQ
jgi:hypothetical protein